MLVGLFSCPRHREPRRPTTRVGRQGYSRPLARLSRSNAEKPAFGERFTLAKTEIEPLRLVRRHCTHEKSTPQRPEDVAFIAVEPSVYCGRPRLGDRSIARSSA